MTENTKPTAWMLRKKSNGFIRGCYAEEPTDIQREHAEIDGEEYVALFDIDAIMGAATRFVAHTELLEAGPVKISGDDVVVSQAVKLLRMAGSGYRKPAPSVGTELGRAVREVRRTRPPVRR
jgi:hypothetical protein